MLIYKCKDVVKIYSSQAGDVMGLNCVSLDIKKGEFITIAGPSGSGKSTFANILGLLDTPTSGSVVFNDFNLSTSKPQDRTLIRRNNIGFIFQSFNLVPVLTAVENVALACELQGINKQKSHKAAKNILSEIGLSTMLDRFPNQLSGGQQQRVSIARAVVKKPAVLLADEPTANLDSANTKEIIGLLNTLNEQYNITCIVCSHDQRVLDASKRVIYITDGKISSDKTFTKK